MIPIDISDKTSACMGLLFLRKLFLKFSKSINSSSDLTRPPAKNIPLPGKYVKANSDKSRAIDSINSSIVSSAYLSLFLQSSTISSGVFLSGIQEC